MEIRRDTTISTTMCCQECGQLILWTSEDDDFAGVIDKLIHHIKNDTHCFRNRKLK
jgi:hypothetical protein